PDDVPEFLRHVVDKALEKEPGDRYQSMQDLVVDLKRVARKATGSQSAVSSSDVRVVAGVVKRHPGLVLGVAAALVLAIVGATYVALSGLAPPSTPQPPAAGATSGAYEIAQLTTTGNAVAPAISPDGKYVAYTQVQQTDTGPATSLWIRQIATASNAVVVPPQAAIATFGSTVTPDGTFVDYLRGNFQGSSLPALWRVPFIGGNPKPLVENVWGPAGWSPDGRQMAFVRVRPAEASSALIVADADGGHERVLATRSAPLHFLSIYIIGQPLIRPAWSPDGRSIAVFESDTRTLSSRVVVVDVASGKGTVLGSGAADAQGLAWLGPDALVLSQSAGVAQRVQLWRLSYPGGALSRLTNDLNSYVGVDVDAARTSLVTSRRDSRASLWVGDADGAKGAEIVRPAPFGAPLGRVAWAGGRVLYDGEVNGQYTIAAVSPDGGAPEELVANGFGPSATSTGDAVVFMSTLSDAENGVWKVSGSSRQRVSLVRGDAFMPIVTPDDRNVVFLSTRGGRQSPWIVPIEGGEPVQITDAQAGADSLRISPDGRRLVFLSLDQNSLQGLLVCDLPGCANRVAVALPPNGFPMAPRWSADGREIAYLEARRTNIWALPLDGGAPHPITHFADDVPGRTITDFAWSRDGRRLAVLRIAAANDIALLRLKP
ncbi:MAG TPA: hypothetical protein VL131_09825, partial [Gammaproteobacteria bacterium]|nr:hypothetical protein [Gammaproteobacteria bacterium]